MQQTITAQAQVGPITFPLLNISISFPLLFPRGAAARPNQFQSLSTSFSPRLFLQQGPAWLPITELDLTWCPSLSSPPIVPLPVLYPLLTDEGTLCLLPMIRFPSLKARLYDVT